MTTITSATNSNHSFHSTTQSQTLSSDQTLLTDGFRDGLSAADFYKAKAKERRLLKQDQSKGKNKENVPSVARRSKDQMANPPSLDNLYVLGRQQPSSLRELGKTTYLETYPAGTPHPVPAHPPTTVHVHLGLHAENDPNTALLVANATSTSTPPGSPSLAQGVDMEDDAAEFEVLDQSQEQREVVPSDALYSALFEGSSPLTTPPSSPAPAPRLAVAYEYDPTVFGGEYSPLTSLPSSPSQSTRFSDSDSESDMDLGVLLFERLAARRRVVHRRRYIWSSDEDTDDDSDVEDASFPAFTVSLVHNVELSTSKVLEDVQDAEDVRHESPPIAPTSFPTPPESAQAAVQNGKGKCRATEDIDNDNTELTNATTSTHRAHITAERFDGGNDAFTDSQKPASVATGPSSSMSISFDGTHETSPSKHDSDTTSIRSITRQSHALSGSQRELMSDTLVSILMRKQGDWMLLEDVLEVVKGLGYTWSPEHVTTVIRSYECLIRKENMYGTYYRYEDSMDIDFSRHWGCSYKMLNELAADMK